MDDDERRARQRALDAELRAAEAEHDGFVNDHAAFSATGKSGSSGLPPLSLLMDKSQPDATRTEVLQRFAASITRSDEYITAMLAIVRDQAERVPAVRATALNVLGSAAFQVARFQAHRSAYDAVLHDLVTDPETRLREVAITELAVSHDPDVQQTLLDGLNGAGALPVARDRAIQLLAEDDHLDNLPWLRELYDQGSDDARQEAVRLMGSYPSAVEQLEVVLRDRAESTQVRQQSAASLRHLDRRRFELVAKAIAIDEDEEPDVRATSLHTLRHLSDNATLHGDAKFMERLRAIGSDGSAPDLARCAREILKGPTEVRMSALDATTGKHEIAAAIDALRVTPDGCDALVALLDERAEMYTGRTSAQVTRLRGYTLHAFADTGLPAAARPYVLEVLESGHMPYEVAGAAIALSGSDLPASEVVPCLLDAVRNLCAFDPVISFERYDARWPYAEPTTALTEVLRILATLGARAADALPALEQVLAERRLPTATLEALRTTTEAIRRASGGCCHVAYAVPRTLAPQQAAAPALADVRLQDQNGDLHNFDSAFGGKTSIVGFFYTRCTSPYKCSLTVSKLAELQTLIHDRALADRVRMAAVTYDPDFDTPERLASYGRDRGISYDADTRFFARSRWVCRAFELLPAGRQLRADDGEPAPNRALRARLRRSDHRLFHAVAVGAARSARCRAALRSTPPQTGSPTSNSIRSTVRPGRLAVARPRVAVDLEGVRERPIPATRATASGCSS